MEVTPMRFIRSTSFLAALLAAAVLTGCGSSGVGDILGGGSSTGSSTGSGTYDPYNQSTGDVRGTVERVDTLDRRILVNGDGVRSNLRNGNEQTILYYDDRTMAAPTGRRTWRRATASRPTWSGRATG